MPTNTAMELLNAYKLKQQQNPGADRQTLFKYLVWDRFDGTMMMDSDKLMMVAESPTLAALAFNVFAREKPHQVEGMLEKSVRDAIDRFFRMNYPEGL